jgi:ketosteroid isomerase-like protein
MSTTTSTTHISPLITAIESRDADAVLGWYTPDAVLTVLDRDHPPASPAVYRGLDEIGAYYRDVCGRNIEHEVRDAVATEAGFGFAQHCRYPDGVRVVCTTVATLRDGRIDRQTAVQAWDN